MSPCYNWRLAYMRDWENWNSPVELSHSKWCMYTVYLLPALTSCYTLTDTQTYTHNAWRPDAESRVWNRFVFFFSECHLDIYSINRGPYKITEKISFLYVVSSLFVPKNFPDYFDSFNIDYCCSENLLAYWSSNPAISCLRPGRILHSHGLESRGFLDVVVLVSPVWWSNYFP